MITGLKETTVLKKRSNIQNQDNIYSGPSFFFHLKRGIKVELPILPKLANKSEKQTNVIFEYCS